VSGEAERRPRAARRRGGARAGEATGGVVRIGLVVNGERREVLFSGYKTLLEVLREDLGLTGTKHGCELGECGACAVLLDGRPVLSCLLLGVECDGASVTTVEGLARGPALSALQAAFADAGATQCGYCTPGILVTAQALLDHNPRPTREEIAEALSGTLCRCTGYLQIFEAVEAAAGAGPGGSRGRRARRRGRERSGGASEPVR
jgi:aerobic-type carbon monoxide dehydrogenase small subunit (CoxS/CutS family)